MYTDEEALKFNRKPTKAGDFGPEENLGVRVAHFHPKATLPSTSLALPV